ncbi:MAG TPA: 30S ribosome-binding factor RbfA [Chloroflexi bacterium]|nr:30S ribosome-binding factor RbfA [Chloroflexota bacterium]
MATYRRERANSFIKEQITLLMQNVVRDLRVNALTVTEVDLTLDRRIARIYVTSYSGEDVLRDGLEGLESAKGVLRKQLSQLLHWRFTPYLEFHPDRSWEYGAHMDALFEQIAAEENERGGSQDEDTADDRDDQFG